MCLSAYYGHKTLPGRRAAHTLTDASCPNSLTDPQQEDTTRLAWPDASTVFTLDHKHKHIHPYTHVHLHDQGYKTYMYMQNLWLPSTLSLLIFTVCLLWYSDRFITMKNPPEQASCCSQASSCQRVYPHNSPDIQRGWTKSLSYATLKESFTYFLHFFGASFTYIRFK